MKLSPHPFPHCSLFLGSYLIIHNAWYLVGDNKVVGGMIEGKPGWQMKEFLPRSLYYRHACILSCFSCVWLFVTLWTIAHQSLLSMAFSRQENWSGLPCSPSGDLSDPGIELLSPISPTLAPASQCKESHGRKATKSTPVYLHSAFHSPVRALGSLLLNQVHLDHCITSQNTWNTKIWSKEGLFTRQNS